MSHRSRSAEDALHLLPSNALPSEKALSLATRFGDDILPEDIRTLWQPERIPARFLPFLAWAMHVDFWEDDLPDEIKRAMIQNSFLWHRLKGTVWAVENVLETFGFTPRVYEWWEMGTEPHTFGVEGYVKTSEIGRLTEELLRRRALVINILDVVKPRRSHLEYLAIVPEPPDIGLPHDHICRYDYCLYSHGYWPRPVEHWSLTTGEEPLVLGCRYREEIRRIVYLLAPVYGASKYDAFFRAGWRSFGAREHVGYTHITDRIRVAWKRRWIDGLGEKSGWTGTWGDELYRWEAVENRARIWTFPFALGVYSASEPLGSLNCRYGPRYRHMESPRVYGTARYGDLVGPTEWRPIYRYFTRVIPIRGERAPTPKTSRCAIGIEHMMRTHHPGYSSAHGRERNHHGRTLRFDGKRSWLGRWRGAWNRVDETICRTKNISVVREEG